jgi:WD40 repeat protein
VAVGPDGRAAVASGYGGVKICDVALPLPTLARPRPVRRVSATLLAHAFAFVGSVAWVGDLIAAGTDAGVYLLDPARPGAAIGDPLVSGSMGVNTVALSADGAVLASGSSDNTVRLWDVSDPAHPVMGKLINAHTGAVNQVAFSPARRLLASASSDGTVRLWDASDPMKPAQLGDGLGRGDPFSSVAFSPDGRTLAAGAKSRITLWDISETQAPAPIGELGPQSDRILSLAFSPGGDLLAAGDGEGDIVLWDTGRHESLGGDLSSGDDPGKNSAVDGIAFDPKGRFMVSSGRRLPVVVWSSALWSDDGDELRSHVCSIVRRDLTDDEWSDFFRDTSLEGKSRNTCPSGGR